MLSQQQIDAFSDDFRALCFKHEIPAVFVLVKATSEKGSLLVTGGVPELNDYVDAAISQRSIPTAVFTWANAEPSEDKMYEAARRHVKEMLKPPG